MIEGLIIVHYAYIPLLWKLCNDYRRIYTIEHLRLSASSHPLHLLVQCDNSLLTLRLIPLPLWHSVCRVALLVSNYGDSNGMIFKKPTSVIAHEAHSILKYKG